MVSHIGYDATLACHQPLKLLPSAERPATALPLIAQLIFVLVHACILSLQVFTPCGDLKHMGASQSLLACPDELRGEFSYHRRTYLHERCDASTGVRQKVHAWSSACASTACEHQGSHCTTTLTAARLTLFTVAFKLQCAPCASEACNRAILDLCQRNLDTLSIDIATICSTDTRSCLCLHLVLEAFSPLYVTMPISSLLELMAAVNSWYSMISWPNQKS